MGALEGNNNWCCDCNQVYSSENQVRIKWATSDSDYRWMATVTIVRWWTATNKAMYSFDGDSDYRWMAVSQHTLAIGHGFGGRFLSMFLFTSVCKLSSRATALLCSASAVAPWRVLSSATKKYEMCPFFLMFAQTNARFEQNKP